MRYTVVFEWEGRGPAISSKDEFLGGKPCAVVFDDELVRMDRITAAVDEHSDALLRCADLIDGFPELAPMAREFRLSIDKLRDSFSVRSNAGDKPTA